MLARSVVRMTSVVLVVVSPQFFLAASDDSLSVKCRGDAKQAAIRVLAKIDRAQVLPETSVRLTQCVPASEASKISLITNHVVRIGKFDARSGDFVYLRPNEFHEEFEVVDNGLPFLKGFSKPRELDKLEDGRLGVIFEFKAKRLGVFLIYSEWTIGTDEVEWLTTAVVLTVKPPLDKEGKPILKPGWLDDE